MDISSRPLRLIEARIKHFNELSNIACINAEKTSAESEVDYWLYESMCAGAVAQHLTFFRNRLANQKAEITLTKTLITVAIGSQESSLGMYEDVTRKNICNVAERYTRQLISVANTIVFELKTLLNELND